MFGQSAGSFDVIALLASPLTRGLIHRAIAQSGSPTGQGIQPLADAEQAGARAAEKLKAHGANELADLRSLPPAELWKVSTGVNPFIADGWVFDRNATEVLPPGAGLAVPLIIGSAGIEFPAHGPPEQQRKTIHEVFKHLAPRALALYGLADGAVAAAPDPVYGNAADQLGSDLLRCPAVVQGEWHASTGNSVWEYEFDRAIPPRPHVGHSSDLPYVFGNLSPSGSQGGSFQDADRKLSATIQAYWTNFARTGNPNGPGLPDWPQHEAKARKFLRFTTTAEIALDENQRGPFCDLFRELLNQPDGKR